MLTEAAYLKLIEIATFMHASAGRWQASAGGCGQTSITAIIALIGLSAVNRKITADLTSQQ
jgi:hypothetical protein